MYFGVPGTCGTSVQSERLVKWEQLQEVTSNPRMWTWSSFEAKNLLCFGIVQWFIEFMDYRFESPLPGIAHFQKSATFNDFIQLYSVQSFPKIQTNITEKEKKLVTTGFSYIRKVLYSPTMCFTCGFCGNDLLIFIANLLIFIANLRIHSLKVQMAKPAWWWRNFNWTH